MGGVSAYEDSLARWVRERLRAIPSVRLFAAPDGVRKTPTIAFRVKGRTPQEVCRHALKRGVYIASGDFYATTLAQVLGIGETGSWVRAGLAPYTTREEVERLVESVEEVAR